MMASGQEVGHSGGGSLESPPVKLKVPVMVAVPAVLNVTMPLPLVPLVFVTEMTLEAELRKLLCRVASLELPSSH